MVPCFARGKCQVAVGKKSEKDKQLEAILTGLTQAVALAVVTLCARFDDEDQMAARSIADAFGNIAREATADPDASDADAAYAMVFSTLEKHIRNVID